jgi:hypothetical protein
MFGAYRQKHLTQRAFLCTGNIPPTFWAEVLLLLRGLRGACLHVQPQPARSVELRGADQPPREWICCERAACQRTASDSCEHCGVWVGLGRRPVGTLTDGPERNGSAGLAASRVGREWKARAARVAIRVGASRSRSQKLTMTWAAALVLNEVFSKQRKKKTHFTICKRLPVRCVAPQGGGKARLTS